MEVKEWTWEAYELEEYIVFNSPNGFRFEFSEPKFVLETIRLLSHRDTSFDTTKHSERFFITPNGRVCVVDCDRWINSEWLFGDPICDASELATVLANYLQEKIVNEI